MNLLLFDEMDKISEGRIRIQDSRRVSHLLNVLKVQPGTEIKVGQVNGRIGWAVIESVQPHVEARFELIESPPEAKPVRLMLALPRPKMLRRILYSAVNLGVKRIHLFHSYHVEKSYWTSDYLDLKSLESTVFLPALEQAVDTVKPVVTFHRFFRPFVEDEVPRWIDGKSCWLAHPDPTGGDRSSVSNSGSSGAHVLAMGPERGFIDFEIRRFADLKFKTLSLGSRVLRTEVAVPAVLSWF